MRGLVLCDIFIASELDRYRLINIGNALSVANLLLLALKLGNVVPSICLLKRLRLLSLRLHHRVFDA